LSFISTINFRENQGENTVNKNFKLKKSSRLVSAALAGGLAVTGAAAAEENVFAASELPSGYMVADAHGGEGKCGEGKCGEGKCGEGKRGEGKCGEGKCGEGKCGEGKCGENKE